MFRQQSRLYALCIEQFVIEMLFVNSIIHFLEIESEKRVMKLSMVIRSNPPFIATVCMLKSFVGGVIVIIMIHRRPNWPQLYLSKRYINMQTYNRKKPTPETTDNYILRVAVGRVIV